MVMIKELNEKYKITAPKIPVLPDVVTVSECSASVLKLNAVPVGIEKESLNVRNVDVVKYFGHVITGMEFSDIQTFGGLFIKEISNILNKQCYVFDMEKVYKDYAPYVSYFDNNILDLL